MVVSSVDQFSSRACTYQRLIAHQLPREPQERLLEVVVGLGGDVVVLEILLAVEGDGLRLDLALLHVDLVSGEHDWDVLAHTDEIAVPVGHVLVGDAGGDVEHDDAALAVDVVAITKTAELLLPRRVPDVELDWAEVLRLLSVLMRALLSRSWTYRGEAERVHLNTECGDVLLLELTRQMALDKGSLLLISRG